MNSIDQKIYFGIKLFRKKSILGKIYWYNNKGPTFSQVSPSEKMPAPRKALVSKKTPVAMISHVLNALDKFWAMDASLRKEGKKPLIEKECLQSAHLALLGIRIHARKIQKEQFDAACKKFEEGDEE